MGLGAFPETHPLSLQMLGMHGTVYANYAIDEADLLLVRLLLLPHATCSPAVCATPCATGMLRGQKGGSTAVRGSVCSFRLFFLGWFSKIGANKMMCFSLLFRTSADRTLFMVKHCSLVSCSVDLESLSDSSQHRVGHQLC